MDKKRLQMSNKERELRVKQQYQVPIKKEQIKL